jgi:NADPH:quinone reductase
MRAVVLREFGPPENLAVEEVPDPEATPGRAVIRVAVAGITFVETQVRAGSGPAHVRPALPTVPGNGVGGEVVAVGPGAPDGLLGATVVSTTGGTGGYAELAAVDAAEPIPVPDGLTVRHAVALLADGRTALGLARATAPEPGQWVLVEAAAGGVGGLLVQLCRAAGARVVGAVGGGPGSAKAARATEAGAELVVDYRETGWADRVAAVTGGVHIAFDGVGGAIGAAAARLVRPGGVLCVHGASGGPMTSAPEGVRSVGLAGLARDPAAVRALAVDALAEAAAGRLIPFVGQEFPLAEAARAHAAVRSRATLGKTLLIP